MNKKTVRLKVKELMKAQIDHDIKSDAELAEKMGISPSQVWRAKLQKHDKRYNTPGNQFIAGVLSVFNCPFEKFFYIEKEQEEERTSDEQMLESDVS
ncbi:hypothetical protein NST63_00860 [Heyndrickxia sp. FSL W8-0496]|uniref:hypothetical protein n=1 Tax=Heyndrickxia sp. FSL W8-0496 TaxID=2954702 RepID=UPI0030FB0D1C